MSLKSLEAMEEFLKKVLTGTKHGPRGSGLDGPCDPYCIKCEAQKIISNQLDEVKQEVKRLKDRPPMGCMTCEEHNMRLADELNVLGRWRDDTNDARRSLAFNTWLEASGANEWDPKKDGECEAWMKGELPKQKEETEKFNKWWDAYENKFFH